MKMNNPMIKSISIFSLLGLLMSFTFQKTATKYFTRDGVITFYSDAPLEKISGVNNQVNSLINDSSGAIEFTVLVKGFEFQKALMQEHFNENYMESDKYPKAIFKGTITNKETVKWTVDGEYPVTIAGKMTLHGVTKDLTAKGKILVSKGEVSSTSTFNILISDYGISIPSVVKDKVSNSVKIEVAATYKPFK